MDSRTVGAPFQRRPREGDDGGTIALPNNDDAGMDSGAVANGDQDTPGASAVLEEMKQAMSGELSILRTDTF
jgi:hypothetical protein